jgi:hypothetical protein
MMSNMHSSEKTKWWTTQKTKWWATRPPLKKLNDEQHKKNKW